MGDGGFEDEMAMFEAEIAQVGAGRAADVAASGSAGVPTAAPAGVTAAAASAEGLHDRDLKRRKLAPEAAQIDTEVQVPEWQRALLERDRQQMQARRADSEGARAAVEAADRAASTKSGQWMWDKPSNSWLWRETGADAKTGNEAGVATATPAEAAAAADTTRKRKIVRTAAGEIWQDSSMEGWPENDFRIFVGDLAHDTTDQMLRVAFEKYESFNMSRVVKDRRSQRCKGYGFVSIGNPRDGLLAMREMNGKYVGSRPCKLRKSNWKDRSLTDEKKSDLQYIKKFYRK